MARQTRVAEPPAARPRLVVFAGGKGGVGTTTLALGIAVAFAERGSRTMLVDADTEGPAVAALCGIEESATLADVLSLRRTAAEALQTGPGGVRVLPGAWGAGRGEASWASLDRLITQLQSLGSTADLAVIDVGDGGGCVAEHLWRAADMVLVVVTPETAAILNAFAAIKTLAGCGERGTVGILVNRAPHKTAAEEIHSRLALACTRFLGFAPRLAGYIPPDRKAEAACMAGEPVVLFAPALLRQGVFAVWPTD